MILTLAALIINAQAQMKKLSPEETVRFLADKVIENTHRTIINYQTGELFESTRELIIRAICSMNIRACIIIAIIPIRKNMV